MTATRVGQRLGSFEFVSTLGAGGMGEVYRAHEVRLQRDVALKLLLPATRAVHEEARAHLLRLPIP